MGLYESYQRSQNETPWPEQTSIGTSPFMVQRHRPPQAEAFLAMLTLLMTMFGGSQDEARGF